MLKPRANDLNIAGSYMIAGCRYLYRGDTNAPARVWLQVGEHGQEIAGPLALALLSHEEWRWPNVQLLACFSDPIGYDEEGYGFASTEGGEACWPPLWGYRQDDEGFWRYVDRNSTWGTMNENALPVSHREMRFEMDTFKPTFVVTLHETVRSEVKPDVFWQGAGLLLIENFALTDSEIVGAMGRSVTILGTVLRPLIGWLGGIVGIPAWKFTRGALKDNADYNLLTRIADRFEELGGWLPDRKWTRYLELFESRDPLTADGRLMHGPALARADWRTITDYAMGMFGCPGVTTESFKSATVGVRGLDERVDLQLTYVRAVLNTLDEEAK